MVRGHLRTAAFKVLISNQKDKSYHSTPSRELAMSNRSRFPSSRRPRMLSQWIDSREGVLASSDLLWSVASEENLQGSAKTLPRSCNRLEIWNLRDLCFYYNTNLSR